MMSATMARTNTRIDPNIGASEDSGGIGASAGQESEAQQQTNGAATAKQREKRLRRRSSISGGDLMNNTNSSGRGNNNNNNNNKQSGEDKSGHTRRKKGSERSLRSLSPSLTPKARKNNSNSSISNSNESENDSQTSGPDSTEKPKRKLLLMLVENNIEDPDILPIESNIEDPDDDDLPFEVNSSNSSSTNAKDADNILPIQSNIEDSDLLPTECNIEDPDEVHSNFAGENDLLPVDSNIEDPDEESPGEESLSEETIEEEQRIQSEEHPVVKSKKSSPGNKQKKSSDGNTKPSRSLSPVKPDPEIGGETKKSSGKKTKKPSDRAVRSLSPIRASPKQKGDQNSKKKVGGDKERSGKEKDNNKKADKRDKDKGTTTGTGANNAFSERKRKMKIASGKGDAASRPMAPPRSNSNPTTSSEKSHSRSPVQRKSIRKAKSMDDGSMSEINENLDEKNPEKNNGAVGALSPARLEQRKERTVRRANRRASLGGPMGFGINAVSPSTSSAINTMPAINTNVANFVNEERKEMRRVNRRASLSGPMSAGLAEATSAVMDRRKMENEKRAYLRARMRGETPAAERGHLIRPSSAPPTRRLKSILYTRETPRRNGSFNVKFVEEDPTMFVIPDITNQERTELYYTRKDIKMFKIDDINRKQRELEMEEQEKKKGK